MADFPKQIPMVFFWSPYFDSPTTTSREKVRILKKMSIELMRIYPNATCFFVDAPHQMERVLPLSLSALIISGASLAVIGRSATHFVRLQRDAPFALVHSDLTRRKLK